MLPLSAHPIIQQAHDVIQAIEACGASPELTAATMQAATLAEAINNLVNEQCLSGATCVPLDDLASHEQRVVRERAQLGQRIAKLRTFMSTPAFEGLDMTEQRLLQSQVLAMDGYSQVLRRRIDRFTPARTASTQGLASSEDFPLGKACDLSGDTGCDACQ